MARYFLHMYANLKILFAQISILNRLLAYLSWNIIEKKTFTAFGLEPASPVSVNRHALLSTIIHPQEKDASSPELSNTVFSHSP